MYDTLIVGGGPAGLSAALLLGRARRRVLLCDAGEPRNAAARHAHGFLTRDGTPPGEIRSVGRDQLMRYETVEARDTGVEDVVPAIGGVTATLRSGEEITARTLLLATGLADELPAVSGMKELWGTGVHTCPYCDGWEVRDAPLAVYGRGMDGFRLALEMTAWSRDLVLCTDGRSGLQERHRKRLAANGIGLREERIACLEGGDDGILVCVRFEDGGALPRRAMFVSTQCRQRSALAARLGCAMTSKGLVRVDRDGATTVPWVWAAGDLTPNLQLVVMATAEGARAAYAINAALLRQDLV